MNKVKVKEKNEKEHSHLTHIIVYFMGVFLFGLSFFFKEIIVYKNLTLDTLLILISLVVAGYDVVVDGISETINDSKKKKRFMPNVHILMTLAAIGAVAVGEYSEGTLLILIFAGAHILEHYSEDKSKKEITNLLNLNPKEARLIVDDKIKIVDASTLKVGDKIQVLNGDQVPADGTLYSGNGSVNQATITGESIPVDKFVGDEIFASTINVGEEFKFVVTKNSDESTYANIVRLVSDAQENLSKRATLIQKIEPVYVKIVLYIAPIFFLIGLLFWDWDVSLNRTLIVLIVASPCALAVTDVPATLSSISNLAKRGILLKGGSFLETFSDIDQIVFDKTGTLTKGEIKVSDVIYTKDEYEKNSVYFEQIIYSMENKSNHPLAIAISNHFFHHENLEIEIVNDIGVGIFATYNNKEYKLNKPTVCKIIDKDLISLTERLENDGKTVTYFIEEDKLVMIIALKDVLKDEAKEVITYFKSNNIQTTIITGDSSITANAIGMELEVDKVIGNILPKDKGDIINSIKEEGSVVSMVGDGVNDALALSVSDVGIAVGRGSDVAIDVADVVLATNNLSRISYMHKMSKKLKRIVWQNIFFALGVILTLLILNLFGLMKMPLAVFFHEGSTIIVILNGLRMLKRIK